MWREMDVQEILEEVMVDDLYFKATGGGVTFGGGEPLLTEVSHPLIGHEIIAK